tara:strand:- start:1312 stop:1716 length:405 start_codon:yes stop_codon:yes gene_type:complete
MKLARPRPRPEGEHIVPLINVVFLLLIFVMLAGQITSPDPLPIAPAKAVEAEARPNRLTTVSLGANGELDIDGTIVPKSEFVSAVREALAETPERSLLLRPDRASDANALIEVMRLLRTADVVSARLIVVKGSD